MRNNNTINAAENIENVTEIQEVKLVNPVVEKTSAELAKERLRVDLNLSPSVEKKVVNQPPVQNENAYRRTISANDSLTSLLGNNAPSNEQSIIRSDDYNLPQVEKKPVFIKWEDASQTEKSKARKIMSLGVITSLIALTYSTFH